MVSVEIALRLIAGLALVETDRRVVGLVTATDAFEAVMGELEDPLDEVWT